MRFFRCTYPVTRVFFIKPPTILALRAVFALSFFVAQKTSAELVVSVILSCKEIFAIDSVLSVVKNHFPVPLKHHTETAFLLILALVIALTGIAVSWLPALPDGLLYWGVIFIASVVYPLALMPLFRVNRADYEFRFLHWFPAFMLLLWLALQALGHLYAIAIVFLLGITYLWSLPLVFFGAFLIIFFALHVIRRRTVRVGATIILMALFLAGSVATEAADWNQALAASVFPQTALSRKVAAVYRKWFPSASLIAGLGAGSSSSSIPMFVPVDHANDLSSSASSSLSIGGSYTLPSVSFDSSSTAQRRSSVSSISSSPSSSSSSRRSVSSAWSSASSVTSGRPASSSVYSVVASASSISSSSSTASGARVSVSSVLPASNASSTITDIRSYNLPAPNPDIIASRDAMEKLRKRRRLPRSGPEDAFMIALTLLASYSTVIHFRAKKRV